MRVITLIIVLPLFSYGQIIVKGKIVDKTTHEGVAYATVGLAKENKGSNANENGEFMLQSTIPGDTLIISSVGYQIRRCALADWKDTIIQLDQKPALRPIIVSTKRDWTFSELNYFSKRGDWTLTTSGFQTQVAQHLQAPVENCILTQVKIQNGYILFDSRQQCIFRLRFYDMDTTTGKPSEDLYNGVIEVKANSKIITVNLEEYSIVIPGKDFFVGVEWLMIPYNEHKPDRKELLRNKTYYPCIMMSNEQNSDGVWMLTYHYSWNPYKNARAHISATVKH